jgi:hypothetical protein
MATRTPNRVQMGLPLGGSDPRTPDHVAPLMIDEFLVQVPILCLTTGSSSPSTNPSRGALLPGRAYVTDDHGQLPDAVGSLSDMHVDRGLRI